MSVSLIVHVEDNPTTQKSIRNFMSVSSLSENVAIRQFATLSSAQAALNIGDIPNSPETVFVLDGEIPQKDGVNPELLGPELAKEIRAQLNNVLIIGFSSNGLMSKGLVPELDESFDKLDGLPKLIDYLDSKRK